MNLRNAYRREGRNIITPYVLKIHFDESKNRVVELSRGEGFEHREIWGVTELIFDEYENRIFPEDSNSKCFHNEKSAYDYFNELVDVG